MSCLHFTSGTTGMPKGAIHVHNAVLVHYMTAKYALDLHPEDIFWCTADPGWVTGTSYGVIAPLLHGVTNIVDEAEFDAERWYTILQDQKVTRVVHRPYRHPPPDAPGYQAPRSVRSEPPALFRQRGRAAQPRGGGVGQSRCSICSSTITGGRPRPAGS